MRRQLHLQDYDMPSLNLSVQTGQDGGKKSFGLMTQYKTQKVEIQTLIMNGNKEVFGAQVSEKNIRDQINRLNNPDQGEQNQNGQDQIKELSEEEQKKVDRFLRKTVPVMQKQLAQTLPFYEHFGLNSEKTYFKKQTRLTYTLENLDSVYSATGTSQSPGTQQAQLNLVISDVAWNSTGVIVAAVYCQPEHETTCSHKSQICLWAIHKRNFKPTKPDTIHTANCLNCIEFHPKRPSIFVVGNYVGQVLLYDFGRKGQQLLAKTLIDDYFHRDVISTLSWWPFRTPGKSETNYNVLSLSTDGKILLWEVPNVTLSDDAPVNRVKALFRNPIKGFSILRKKEGVIVPVSALSMKQSKVNKNIFIVGSEGGSILKASLSPINHYINTQGKILLDMQQGVKFRKQVYPFLLNVPQKQFRNLKQFLQKVAKTKKIQQIDNVAAIYAQKPDLQNLYPNVITFAYEPLAYPIASLSFNRYGQFIANGCDGYSRLYVQSRKQHLQSFEQGYEWGWINEGLKIGGFIGQQFVIVDWTTGSTLYSAPVGQSLKWKQSSNSSSLAVICEKTKIKIIQLGDKMIRDDQQTINQMNIRLAQLLI